MIEYLSYHAILSYIYRTQSELPSGQLGLDRNKCELTHDLHWCPVQLQDHKLEYNKKFSVLMTVQLAQSFFLLFLSPPFRRILFSKMY